jgi:hypothetical protein
MLSRDTMVGHRRNFFLHSLYSSHVSMRFQDDFATLKKKFTKHADAIDIVIAITVSGQSAM